MSIAEDGRRRPAGRERQRARTRQALLDAAKALMREGRQPSLQDAGERALVSIATAYRYFPNAAALWEEAAFEMAPTEWDPADIDAAGDDVGRRLDRVITTIGWGMLDEETAFRIRARAALETWFAQAAVPEGERVAVREGRRNDWNARVVEPLRGLLPDETIDELMDGLSLIWGPEAMIVLRDVRGLDRDEAKGAMLRSARWLLQGAMAEIEDRATREPAGEDVPH